MYTVQRKQTINDELVINDSKGEEALRLPVKLHIDDILAQYNRLRAMLGEAQHNLQTNPTDEVALTSYGLVLTEFFSLIFGRAGCDKLIAFYGDNDPDKCRWTEMLMDVAPFVTDVINPQVQAAMKERAERFRRMSR